ncbi:tetratricopeptide repeat-containing sensor histidine kinase [Bacteroidales bacterium OttesenSCG-928-K03]|nr:tetratricopeptide repeat-containing sensor histidine kinase [Odoribacter sp. OttesenSCG-928-L07]MDL2239350.1 tetratricopeptide repeat-containing sensor histidine kinase [Bacteroidales bacterium OttesenSCG-928-L14]MDL2240749.1 tetratricopeptide repeat-containing sensor histidine kinase [Bacteroidales bacterium OttesenSCG-928-K22]MDL2242242.1 tetratricopeptide repeat-containing sensor histidine kinase [Bacteroidales bacterium OttesenSCG-928-K03]
MKIKFVITVFFFVFFLQNVVAKDTGIDYYSKAIEYYIAAKNDSAMIIINEGLEITDSTDFLTCAKMYILRGILFGNMSIFEKSTEDAFKALTISEQHGLKETEAAALLCIGKIHYMMYNDDLAEEFMLKAYEIAEQNNLHKELIETKSAMAEFYTVLEKADEALPLHEQSLELSREQSDTVNIIKCLISLGDYYIHLNRWSDPIVEKYQIIAKKYLDEAGELLSNKKMQLHNNNLNISLIRWSRVEKDYQGGLNYAQEILNTADPNNYTLLLQVYDHLVALYSHLGDSRKTIQSHNQFYSIMLKQSSYKMHYVLQEMEVKYETAAKELQIEKQQIEINRQRTRSYVFIIAFGVSILIVVLLFIIIRLSRNRNRELKEINATKDKFFSIISHDLRNPAIAQRNALFALVEHEDEWSKDVIKKYHNELLKSAEGELDLVNSLLNWAQVQTGRMPFNPTTFDLTDVVKSETKLMRNVIKNKNIQLTLQMPDTVYVNGDRNMLSTVIRNLLANAIKFTEKGGEVSLEITPADDNYYCVSIKDTGIGMNKEQINDIFRIDYQQSKSGTAGEQGSGLGLIVCKELLEKHGSVLEIESEKGKGSVFSFGIKKV